MVWFWPQQILQKIKVFHLNHDLYSSSVCIENQTIVANTVSSKTYSRNLLVSFKFSNYHFYSQNCHFCALFPRLTAYMIKIQKQLMDTLRDTLRLLYSKNGISSFYTEKAFRQNVSKLSFFVTFDSIAGPWGQNRKKAAGS